MIVAIKVSTKNDVNGNPRRAYIVNKVHGEYAERLAVIDEDYWGMQALRKQYPDAILLQEIEVAPAEYRKWIKVGINDEKLKAE